jgi:hypothetical protein
VFTADSFQLLSTVGRARTRGNRHGAGAPRDGKIVVDSMYYESMAVLLQLGLVRKRAIA